MKADLPSDEEILARVTKRLAKQTRLTLYVRDNDLLDAIQFCWEENIWPSARNIATLLGYQQAKLTGKMNRRRKEILRGLYGM